MQQVPGTWAGLTYATKEAEAAAAATRLEVVGFTLALVLALVDEVAWRG
jgi:hypothetical protein